MKYGLIASDEKEVQSFLGLQRLLARSLLRRRSRRACMRFIYTFYMCVYIYVYVCMCADMYIMYIYACVYVFVHLCYTCVCVCVCIFVHRLWVLVSVFQRVDGVMHAHVFSYAYVCVYICVWVYIYVHFFAVSVTCTLQVFWALVHVQVCMLHRCAFTPKYTSANTLDAGCAHMCICIYVCICMYMHMDAYVRL